VAFPVVEPKSLDANVCVTCRGCLVYDLVALAVGQGGSWGLLLAGYAVGSSAIVAARNLK